MGHRTAWRAVKCKRARYLPSWTPCGELHFHGTYFACGCGGLHAETITRRYVSSNYAGGVLVEGIKRGERWRTVTPRIVARGDQRRRDPRADTRISVRGGQRPTAVRTAEAAVLHSLRRAHRSQFHLSVR